MSRLSGLIVRNGGAQVGVDWRVVLALTLLAAWVGAVVVAAASPAVSAAAVDKHRTILEERLACESRLSSLVNGMESVLNRLRRRHPKEAEEAAQSALTAAGFVCKPVAARAIAQGNSGDWRFECTDGQ